MTAVGSDVIKMAEAEGLQAHANAIRVRMEKEVRRWLDLMPGPAWKNWKNML